MLEYLNKERAKMYGIDCTYKIIPKSYAPYKLMTINAIDPINHQTIIAAFICIKFTDSESLLKLFGLLKSLYSFSPITVNTDFDNSQIKALKNCDDFIKTPNIITCLFHFSQNIIKKLKEYNIIK